ncbi:hypothetical protein [Caviibacterium pharyngocola]|uniref:Uncharacterized protein n=1 Tax=Caviibacterium pharyngocola TaxID=28159 RepID=A0A2M8RSW4_9PAST|nr:hypothetical protein [Caviibacterium pharyngocola]PJG81972.1 hypothetical protein CVP04_11365 [Caviibacterium pharyngocola]
MARRKTIKIKPFQPKDDRLPTWEQLVKAIKETDLYLGFAKTYIHNGHLQGATQALRSIKRATTTGLKIKE